MYKRQELYTGDYDKLEAKHLRKLARFGVELSVERVPALITDCNYKREKILTLRSQGIDIKRSEEHTSELQSRIRISYAVFFIPNSKTLRIKAFRIMEFLFRCV